jgi:hypothetical protein
MSQHFNWLILFVGFLSGIALMFSDRTSLVIIGLFTAAPYVIALTHKATRKEP